MAHTSTFTFIGMLVRVIYELISTNKHIPLRKINFHISIMAAPVSCLGSYIGVKFNVNAPKIVVLAVLTLISCYLVYLSFLEYKKKIKTENEAKIKKAYSEANAIAPAVPDQQAPQQVQMISDRKPSEHPAESDDHRDQESHPHSDSQASESKRSLKKEKRRQKKALTKLERKEYLQNTLTWTDILLLVLIMALNPFLSFGVRMVNGNKTAVAGKCDSREFYVLGAYVLGIVVLTVISCVVMYRRNQNRDIHGNQIVLDKKMIARILIGSFLISLFGAAFSIAIAMLFTLYFISMQMTPFTASATSMFMTLVCFTNSTFLYIVDGKVQTKIGIIGSAVVILSVIGTRFTIYQKMMDLGKGSLMMLFMVILVALAQPLNLWQVIPTIIDDQNAGKNIWAFKSFCV